MKPYIVLILMLCSIRSVAQIDYKRQLDSLTTVHKICTIENMIRNHRVKLDQLKKERKNLNTQFLEIQSFQLGRTDAEKEEQLLEINVLIETNAAALTNATVQLTTLINELVLANEDVKTLQNR
jgi:seryl-tRNA synthetase